MVVGHPGPPGGGVHVLRRLSQILPGGWLWTGSGLGENAADVRFGAVGGVGGCGPALKAGQCGAGAGELGDPLVNLGQVLADKAGHVAAGGLPAIPDGQNSADFCQGESGGLSLPDERQPTGRPGWVVAIPRRGARGAGMSPACS